MILCARPKSRPSMFKMTVRSASNVSEISLASSNEDGFITHTSILVLFPFLPPRIGVIFGVDLTDDFSLTLGVTFVFVTGTSSSSSSSSSFLPKR